MVVGACADPERINACAQAVIQTLQADDHRRGCLMEELVLKGDLAYESSMPGLAGDEERLVLLAMHQTLVARGLCLRQPTVKGNLLVFSGYYRRKCPMSSHLEIYVSYTFTCESGRTSDSPDHTYELLALSACGGRVGIAIRGVIRRGRIVSSTL